MMFKRIGQMYKIAVRDNEGRLYMPVWGYDDTISHYADGKTAASLMNDWIKEQANERLSH